MQTKKKQVKTDIKNCIIYLFGFIPVLRIKVRITDKYLIKEYWLFCFIPVFSTEKGLPRKDKIVDDFPGFLEM